MDANVVGALVSGLSALLFIILALLSFRSRRSSNEARDLRAVRATNVAALRWAYQVQVLAAVRGWELPSVPLEMTPEYLAGKAEGEGNAELAQLAQLASSLISPGHTGGAQP